MKTIGILGGMSWESTAVYYRRLNELVQAERGGLASASILLRSFDFSEIEVLQHEERWNELDSALGSAALDLRHAGAELLVIATNTMHLLADTIAETSGLRLVHITDAVADVVLRAGYGTVALLGTRFTMEQPFYRERLQSRSGSNVLIPDEHDRLLVHRVIYDELCAGILNPDSREALVDVASRLTARGAQAIVLGCTELPLLLGVGDTPIPTLDSTEIHVRKTVEEARE